MKVLVLGGTQFVGRHIVQALLSGGHSVSIFTRGQTPDELPPEVERLRGDRNAGQLEALTGRTWDACVDVSGYLPRVVTQSAELLQDAVQRYLFISTISIYADNQSGQISEESALSVLTDPHSENIAADYGALKVACEQAVRRVYGERASIVRPGLVAGPYDHTKRFTFWVLRAAQGGTQTAPGDGQDAMAVIDARDLAAFTVHLLETDEGGIFNAVGEPLPLADFLREVGSGVGVQTKWQWNEAAPPDGAGESWPLYVRREPLLAIQPQRARTVGLRLRPLAETARDTLAWAREQG